MDLFIGIQTHERDYLEVSIFRENRMHAQAAAGLGFGLTSIAR
jgi:hypothetical protein